MVNLTDGEIREVQPHLQRFALWLTKNPANVEDLVQSCLEKALTWRGKREDIQSLRAWLFSILYRQFIDGERRKRRYQALLSLFTAVEDTAPSAESMAINDAMLAIFAGLPSEQRALLLLVSVEGLSYKEVAETLGIPLGTVMSRLSRTRRQLSEMTEGMTPPTVIRRMK